MSSPFQGRAVRVLPSGIILRFEDGKEGFLPRREFPLGATRDLRQMFQSGQVFDVLPVENSATDGRTLFRLAVHDYWEQFIRDFPPGAFITGWVSGIEPYGLFVSLGFGLTGLVPREQIAPGKIGRIEDVIWVGDPVLCQVVALDGDERRIELSIAAAAAARTDHLKTGEGLTPLPPAPSTSSSSLTSLPLPLSSLRFLIVDDHPETRQQLARYLKRLGFLTEAVESVAAAREMLQRVQFDWLLIDVHMAGTNGIEFAESLLAEAQPPRVTLMTDFSQATMFEKDLTRLRGLGVDLLTKPYQEPELKQLLEGQQTRGGPLLSPPSPARARNSTSMNLGLALREILRRARNDTNASALFVFGANSRIQRLDILAQAGEPSLDPADKQLQAHWRYMPIRDVMEDGDVVNTRDIRNEKDLARFRYMIPLFPFGSCYGLPIPGTKRAAFFAFHPDAEHFNRQHRQILRAAAERIGAALERQETMRILQNHQRDMVLGQVSNMHIHELTNKLNAVRYNAQSIDHGIQSLLDLGEDAPSEASDQLWYTLEEDSKYLLDSVEALAETQRGYDLLVREQESTQVNLHDLLRQTLRLSQRLAAEKKVGLREQLEHPNPVVLATPAWVEQAILNLLLNAIQQIAAAQPSRAGNVLVTTRPGSTGRAVQIHFFDDGPGIHAVDRERIFDLGFTTREGGSGLGLYVTRNLIEMLEGRISVEESYMQWGTTFVIELPLVNEQS